MAERYPTYQRSARLNANIVTPPNVDNAALRQAAKGYQQIGQAADRVVNFALKRGEEQAISRGKAQGALDSSASIEAYKDTGGENSYERAAYAAAVGISSAQVETKARAEMATALFEWKKNKGDPDELQQRLASIRDGYAEAIGDLDPVTGASLRDKLQGVSNAAFVDYSGDYLKTQNEKLNAGRLSTLDSVREQADVLARAGVENFDAQLDVVLGAYAETALASGQAPDALELDIQKLRRGANIARVRGSFDREFADGQGADFLKRFDDDVGKRKGVARGLNEASIKTLRSEITAKIRGEAASLRNVATQVKGDARALLGVVGNGDTPGEKDVASVVARARQSGDPDAIRLATQLQAGIEATKSIDTMSISASEAYLAEIKGAYNADGVNEVESAILQLMEKRVSSKRTAMGTNQVELYNRQNPKNPLPGISPQMSAGLALFDSTGGDATLAFAPGTPLYERKQKIDAMASGSRYDPLYLSRSEIKQFDAFFQDPDVSPETKLASVVGLRRAFGDDASTVLNQLDAGQGKTWVHAAAVAEKSGNVAFFDNVITALMVPDELKVPSGVARRAAVADISRELTSAFNPRDQAQAVSTAKLAYTARLNAGAAEDDEGALWRKTLQESFGATFGDRGDHISGGVSEIGGAPMILSPHMTLAKADALDNNLSGLTAEKLVEIRRANGQSTALPLINGRNPLRKSDFENAQLKSTGRADEAFLLNERDESYIDADGNPYVIFLGAAYDALVEPPFYEPFVMQFLDPGVRQQP